VDVELSGQNSQSTIVVECTSKGFKWRNVEKNPNLAWKGEATWRPARAAIAATK
jgi:hypothetical protein